MIDASEGRRALAEARWEDAARAYEAALARDAEDPEALTGLGVALYWLEKLDRSFDLRESAYRILTARGERAAAARIAMGIAIDVADYRGMAVASGWLARAQSLLDGLELVPEHGWLALWQGHFIRAIDHDLPRAREYAATARAIARELRLPDLELLTIALEGLINVTAGNVREGMRQLDEATVAAVAGELREVEAIVATCCFLVHACERVCDWERAAQWDAQIRTFTDRWRLGSVFAACRAEHAAMLIGRGEWERAEREIVDAIATIEATRPLVLHEAIVQLAELRRRQGRLDEAAGLFQRCPTTTESILGLAAIALERNDPLRAADALERLRRRPMAEKWVQRALTLALLVRARIESGDRPGALAAAAELREIAAAVGIDLVAATAKCADARVAGDDAEARRLLEDAIDLYARCPAPWEAAHARLALADVLRRLGRDSFAAEEIAAARETLARLGVSLSHPPRSSPLTKRELEVLRLVARGLSDKEVAIQLRLSEHTVHRHVSNVLAKLEVPSRTAAVAHAAAAGWMADSGH